MRFLSVKGDVVPFDTFGSLNDAQRQAHSLKHRSLLDMQFEIGGGVFLFFLGFGKFVDLDTALSVARDWS